LLIPKGWLCSHCSESSFWDSQRRTVSFNTNFIVTCIGFLADFIHIMATLKIRACKKLERTTFTSQEASSSSFATSLTTSTSSSWEVSSSPIATLLTPSNSLAGFARILTRFPSDVSVNPFWWWVFFSLIFHFCPSCPASGRHFPPCWQSKH